MRADKLIEPGNVIIGAEIGVSGPGLGGVYSRFGHAESNENLAIAMSLVDNLRSGAAGPRVVTLAGCGLAGVAGRS